MKKKKTISAALATALALTCARAALEQSRAYRQAVQTQLIATIANSYYNLLIDRKSVV